mgnify:FL=1|tara:strand:+ start:68 stop:691 length:624 start_codon:yes stop_codon:yes gene_type:complete
MPFPTTNATQELPAINQILSSCGQAPVTTLDTTNPDVAIAYDTLLQISREVQSEGWTFNKEYHYEFTPDTNDEIPIANNILQIKLTENSNNIDFDGIRRNGKLYDRQHHTYKWTDFDTVECDIVWEFDWVDLPQPIQDFITARTATVVSQRIVGDTSQYQMLQQQEAYMRAMALEYETQQGQYTFFGHPQGQTNYYQSYQPYQALKR